MIETATKVQTHPPAHRSRILVGMDGSPASLAAARWAAGVVRPSGAEVLAVHARDPLEEGMPDGSRARRVERSWQAAGRPGRGSGTASSWCTARWFRRCWRPPGRSAPISSWFGGKRGASSWQEAVLGNVSELLSERSGIPVVVVPGPVE